MFKVMWFLKRAPHLSQEEFARWWLDSHAHDVARHQQGHLRRYVVNVCKSGAGPSEGKADEPDWDGVAEQWFENEAAYLAAYSVSPSPTRADTLAHTSRFARLVVSEHEFVNASASLD